MKKLFGKAKPVQPVRANETLMLRAWKSRDYYIMLIPAIVYILLFAYAPMYGLQIAFKNYKVSLGRCGQPVDWFSKLYGLFPELLFYYAVEKYAGPFSVFPDCGIPDPHCDCIDSK